MDKITKQYAIVCDDAYGQTISMFKSEKKADEYMKRIKKTLKDLDKNNDKMLK